ncbi:2-succinyl-5-enolpyruvyl-6-hydroxy-3-cyclohexene-1-carboxylic-acid synthase [Salinibacillus xinjiangensis]|uniref:2-succinyl-5-enolpyruvyl-6-hydroxy-3-cyclohexene-1-carboxylate synthase n=1 Tax=Salinibacillus xinjiangensis TaxID=1229268 RepID=A0A6G1X2R6_9BACI|nr:2-succinyl-5-enolpyruvyl-6-hydroxy-3-cyclohexene-1-carboxylic-acid synthase [Salinibacillus xinjiangensis]MRG85209.1 2-succinyl-5-enolpyruvyl-6-hydroxy-3-cyclohexene-1-carboxylic-acid synthase [Salinibacillus xinjiangensis]
MSHQENLTYYVAQFVDELYQSGIKDVVISPGSRSTPLALTFAEHEHINHWVNLDERSSAFFALGMAKEQQRPVALLCTSGTATANYFPAIIEAFYSRVPLVVLTADRPHELRDVGAPQSINQLKMYGDYVKWFHEMTIPEATIQALSYARSIASRAVAKAESENSGPVHLNFPLREPLTPDFSLPNIWGRSSADTYHHHIAGERKLDSNQVNQILTQIKDGKRGLLICGPQTDLDVKQSIFTLAKHWNIPVLADPLSQLRAGKHNKGLLIECYDSILKSEQIRNQLKPDFIIRFGAMPVSKPYMFFIKENPDVPHFVVESYEGYREPTLHQTKYVYSDPSHFCAQCVEHNQGMEMDPVWTNMWVRMNDLVKAQWLEEESEKVTEGHAVTEIKDAMKDQHILFTGNSMPVRDVDTFFTSTEHDVQIMGNRGANGIDGIVSSAIGAASHGKKVTLLIGDLSFYHDLNGLLVAKQYGIDLTVVLINNNGGGIFSFLPQAKEPKHFEVLFGTPLDLEFSKVVDMYGGHHVQVESRQHLRQKLEHAYEQGGIHVLEVQTNREENASWHRNEWQQIETKLLQIIGEES